MLIQSLWLSCLQESVPQVSYLVLVSLPGAAVKACSAVDEYRVKGTVIPANVAYTSIVTQSSYTENEVLFNKCYLNTCAFSC